MQFYTFPLSRPSYIILAAQVLEAQGHTIVPPSDRKGLQPLLIPLSSRKSPKGPLYTCFLRWPDLSSTRVRTAVMSV